MIISLDGENAFDRIQHPFMIKSIKDIQDIGAYLNILKEINNMSRFNTEKNREKLKVISIKAETRQGFHLLYFYLI